MLADAGRVRRELWAVEREIERSVSADGPLLVGPWTGEVGYEVLYWVPFLRWLCAAYRLPLDRVIAVSRGGTATWYAGIAGTYVDAFDVMSPEAFGSRARTQAAEAGTSKQFALSPLDRELVEGASRQTRTTPGVVHPSLMFRLFRTFWSGHAPLSFLERHMRVARIAPPALGDTGRLPREYVVVKFYTARSLPAEPQLHARLREMVSSLALRSPVVLLDTALRMDEHEDFAFDDIPNTISARPLMTPATNLGVQTQIIAGARGYVGTCGSVAWLAPMLGIDTVAVLADAGFLHAHLHVARRAYHKLPGAGAFSPCDVGALMRLGLTVGS